MSVPEPFTCTYHDYEGMYSTLGLALDNSPGWCGIRYSKLDLTRVIALNGINEKDCNKCIQIFGESGLFEYVLVIDLKVAAGIDMSKSVMQKIFPSQDPLNPKSCSYNFVDFSFCSDICTGNKFECTESTRNIIPPYLFTDETSC